MKYIKKFDEEIERSIEGWCENLNLFKYNIDKENLIVNTNDGVIISAKRLNKIPIQFGVVNGDFDCSNNILTSLEGSPEIVNGHFICYRNSLKSLKYCAKEINDGFYCYHNELTSLKYAPKISKEYVCAHNKLISLDGGPEKINNNFNCGYNELTNLIGGPIEVYGPYSCIGNKLISLEGCPKEIGYIRCENNPIFLIYELFEAHMDYIDSLDYNYLRGDCIIKLRFQEACEEANIEMPDSIPGYKYI